MQACEASPPPAEPVPRLITVSAGESDSAWLPILYGFDSVWLPIL